MGDKIRNMSLGLGLGFLRITIGGFMLFAHGLPKIMSFQEKSSSFPDPLGIGSHLSLMAAIGAEAGCAALLMLGIATRLVALPILFTMLIAAFVIHGDDPFMKKEFALLYAIPLLTLSLTGGGSLSIGNAAERLKRWS